MCIRDSVVAAAPIYCPRDIILVIDGSGQVVSDLFKLQKAFLAHIVGRLDVNGNVTRVGLVFFSTDVEYTFSLETHLTVASVQTAILKLSQLTGGTNTAKALAYVRTTLLTPEAGDRSDVSNVVILFIDGNSDNRTASQVS